MSVTLTLKISLFENLELRQHPVLRQVTEYFGQQLVTLLIVIKVSMDMKRFSEESAELHLYQC